MSVLIVRNRIQGTLANAELRKMRMNAHKTFDPLWERAMRQNKCSKSKARGEAYKWLAKKLEIDVKDCHIGRFDIDQCKKVIEICTIEISLIKRKEANEN